MRNVVLLFLLLFIAYKANAAQVALEQVIREKVLSSEGHIRDLNTVAERERIRAWLPTSPTVTYSSNDNHTWKAWSLNTSLPFPLIKSLYRDKFEVSRVQLLKSKAKQSKQEILRSTVEIYLECSIPSEMARLLKDLLKDQKIITSITASLYATGAVPQADRVASELQLRQIEAQVQMQKDLAFGGCSRWGKWSELPSMDETDFTVVSDISDKTLRDVGIETDSNKDVLQKSFENISLNREKLWSKYIPDLEISVSKNNYFDLYLSGGPPVKYTYSWSVGITLPFNFPVYDNTEFRRESAELGLQKIQTMIEKSESEKNWEQSKKDWKRISRRLEEISRKDLALAEAFVQSSMASYRAGKVGLADLVLARRTRLDLQIEEINLKAQKILAKTVCLTECEL